MHLLPKIEGVFILHTCDFCWLTSKTYDNLNIKLSSHPFPLHFFFDLILSYSCICMKVNGKVVNWSNKMIHCRRKTTSCFSFCNCMQHGLQPWHSKFKIQCLNLECHGCKDFWNFFIKVILLQNPQIEMKRLKCFISIYLDRERTKLS